MFLNCNAKLWDSCALQCMFCSVKKYHTLRETTRSNHQMALREIRLENRLSAKGLLGIKYPLASSEAYDAAETEFVQISFFFSVYIAKIPISLLGMHLHVFLKILTQISFCIFSGSISFTTEAGGFLSSSSSVSLKYM